MKYIIEISKSGNLDEPSSTSNGVFLDTTGLTEFKGESKAEQTLQLVKQGVTVDEIIKLKNAELL